MWEQFSETNASERAPEITKSELETGLSSVWWKTVQEIVPGKLRDVPKDELTKGELAMYNHAYHMMGEMVSAGNAEISFREEEVDSESKFTIDRQSRRPQFRRAAHRGKREPNPFPKGEPIADF